MTFFRNVLQNIEAVKIRVLENFYAIRMFEKREDEIKMLKVSVWIVSVVNALNYLVPSSSTLFMLIYYTYLRPNKVVKYDKYIQFNQVFDSLKGNSISVIGYWNYLVEIQVSLRRLDVFLNTENMKQLKKELEDGKSQDNSQEAKFKGQKTVVRVSLGSFRWKTIN